MTPLLPMDQIEVASEPSFNPIRAWTTVAMLSLLYILALLDRSVVSLLVTPLKRDLGLSDIQMGLLMGSAFVTVYSVLGVPLARLADRYNRRLLIAAGLVIWSLSTLASGFASSLWELVVLRVGLAIGEAVLTPAAFSMIADMFPQNKRMLPASIYTTAGLIGSSMAFIVGGVLVQTVIDAYAHGYLKTDLREWQMAFILIGSPGLLITLLFLAVVKEPARRGAAGSHHVSLKVVIAHLRENHRLYVGVYLGAAMSGIVNAALIYWTPTYLVRKYAWSIGESGVAFGTAMLLASVSATLIVPQIADWLRLRGQHSGTIIVLMPAIGLGGLLAIVAALQPTAMAFLIYMGCAKFFLTASNSVALTSFQIIAPPKMRATFVALYMMVYFLITGSLGAAGVAWLNQLFFNGNAPLDRPLILLAMMTTPIALLLLLWGRADFRDRMRLIAGESAGTPQLATA